MPAPKPVSYADELKAFADSVKALKYDLLLSTAIEAGWQTLIQEIDAVGQMDGTTLVRFSVAVGRDGKFEPYDTVTVKTGVGPGPVSIAARMLLPQSLVFLFFGRLPEQAPAAEQTVKVNPGDTDDIVLPGERPLEPEPEQEYIEGSAPIDRRAKLLPDLVDHTEPDGVPIFRDLDDLPEHFTDSQIIERLLEDVDKAAVKFDSIAQLHALFAKNGDAIGVKDSFLSDLGTPEDRATLKDILDKHQSRIESNSTVREVKIPGGKGSAVERTPRRRRAA